MKISFALTLALASAERGSMRRRRQEVLADAIETATEPEAPADEVAAETELPDERRKKGAYEGEN